MRTAAPPGPGQAHPAFLDRPFAEHQAHDRCPMPTLGAKRSSVHPAARPSCPPLPVLQNERTWDRKTQSHPQASLSTQLRTSSEDIFRKTIVQHVIDLTRLTSRSMSSGSLVARGCAYGPSSFFRVWSPNQALLEELGHPLGRSLPSTKLPLAGTQDQSPRFSASCPLPDNHTLHGKWANASPSLTPPVDIRIE